MSLRNQSSFIGTLIALAGVGTVGVLTVLPAAAVTPKPAGDTSATVEPADSGSPNVVGNAPMGERTGTENTSNQVAARSSSTIAELTSSNDSFKTLTAALDAAGLTDVLQGEGPYTVFAPTDAAFAALPQGTLEELLKPENRQTLIQILTYHVVPGELTSSQLSSGDVTTVEGDPVSVTVNDNTVKVNDATVVQPDVLASNGVIHVIDRVILPPSLTPATSDAPAAPGDTVAPEENAAPGGMTAPTAPQVEEPTPATPQ